MEEITKTPSDGKILTYVIIGSFAGAVAGSMVAFIIGKSLKYSIMVAAVIAIAVVGNKLSKKQK